MKFKVTMKDPDTLHDAIDREVHRSLDELPLSQQEREAPWVAGASLRIMYPRTTDREVRRVEGLAEALRATAASVIVEEVAP